MRVSRECVYVSLHPLYGQTLLRDFLGHHRAFFNLICNILQGIVRTLSDCIHHKVMSLAPFSVARKSEGAGLGHVG